MCEAAESPQTPGLRDFVCFLSCVATAAHFAGGTLAAADWRLRPLAPTAAANEFRPYSLLSGSPPRRAISMKEISMFCSRIAVMSLLAATLAVGTAQAQTQTPATPPSVSAQAQRTMSDVSNWTRKQWRAAKAKWQEEKTAWNGCQSEAKAQSLSGRKSWQFLYDCMTRS
jgi:hypothetical protein